MELEPIELRLLNILADEWETSGPPGYLESRILAGRLGLSRGRTKSVIHSLWVKGLVDTDDLEHFAAYLTPAGYERIRS